MEYKTLTATTLPMSTIKGLYYLRNGKFREAIPNLKKGMVDNPYLYISESFLGLAYYNLKMPDSSLHYSKIAYEKMPRNSLHFGHYMYALAERRDSIKIKEVFQAVDPNVPDKDVFDTVYLQSMAAVTDPSSAEFILDGIKDLNIQSGNDQLKKGYYSVKVGTYNMYEADKLYQAGMYYFEEENFTAAANYFENAARINPFELVYKENAANAYMRLGNDSKALELLNELIDNDNSKSPKAYYFRGLINFSFGNTELACQDLKYAFDEGLISDINVYQLACLQK